MRLPGNVACRDAGNGIAGAAAKHSVTVCGTSGCPVFPDEPAATPSLNRRDKAGSHAKCRSALGVSTKGRTRTAGTLNKVHWPHKQKRHCLSSAHPRTASFLLGLVHPRRKRPLGSRTALPPPSQVVCRRLRCGYRVAGGTICTQFVLIFKEKRHRAQSNAPACAGDAPLPHPQKRRILDHPVEPGDDTGGVG